MTAAMNHLPANSDPRWRRAVQRLAWLEPFWVVVIGAALLVPSRFLPEAMQPFLTLYRPALTFLLFLFWPIRWLAYGHLTRRTPLDWPLIFILVWLPVNFWASADKTLSWAALSYLLFGVALYLALINWPPACRRPQLIAGAILLVGLGLTLAAPLLTELTLSKLFRVPFFDTVLQRLHTLTPGNVNANRIAGTLILTMPLALSLTIHRRWTKHRWLPLLTALLLVLMLIALALTQSRSAYLAIAVALAVVFILRWPRLIYAALAVIVIGLIALIPIGPRPVLDALLSSSALNGLDGRLELWSRALYAISDFPFTGIGIGTFERVIPVLYPLFSIGPDTTITHAHNLVLQVGVDLGLPGLIAYLALFITTLALTARSLRDRASALDWALTAGAVGGLLAMFIHGIFDAPVWGSIPAVVPWLLIALAIQVGLPRSKPQ